MTRDIVDVVIIGAGVVGTAVARELGGRGVKVLVVDRLNDVGGDASKSNSAIIHTGFDAPPGTVESEMVVRANPMYDSLCRELQIPFNRTGAILVASNEEEEAELPGIAEKAKSNGVDDVRLLTAKEVLALEPAVVPSLRAGLHVPRESVIDPFLLVVAQAEVAAANGVRFITDCEVQGIDAVGEGYDVHTRARNFRCRFLVNAAGMFTDRISAMLGIEDFTVHPRRGQFHVLDRAAGLGVERIILPVPTKTTKGRLLAPTVHGNWLIGPTAEELDDRVEHRTTAAGLDEVVQDVRRLVPEVDHRWAITQYDGLRPVRSPEGYHLRNFALLPGYLELSGIRSTGVTSSIAVALHAREVLGGMGLQMRNSGERITTRTSIPCFREADNTERRRLIRQDPAYGRVVCRCETVTEAEVLQAVRRIPGARDVDGIKRRVRAGLGRCQGGFCGMRVPEILARELAVGVGKVTKKGLGSEILTGGRR